MGDCRNQLLTALVKMRRDNGPDQQLNLCGVGKRQQGVTVVIQNSHEVFLLGRSLDSGSVKASSYSRLWLPLVPAAANVSVVSVTFTPCSLEVITSLAMEMIMLLKWHKSSS
jgi:hypothetical protein